MTVRILKIFISHPPRLSPFFPSFIFNYFFCFLLSFFSFLLSQTNSWGLLLQKKMGEQPRKENGKKRERTNENEVT